MQAAFPLVGLDEEARVSWVLVDLGSETLRLQPPPDSGLPRNSGQNSAAEIETENRGKSYDGRGIGQGDHFLPHKFIKRSFEC